MKIKLHEITVRDLYKDYLDLGEDGVTGYGGKLNIRPKYQREFIYNEKNRNAVIETVINGHPLNTMYWSFVPENEKNGLPIYELLDGQQRTLSILKYIAGEYSVNYRFFHNLLDDEKDKILDYKCQIYICEGTESERLAWFKKINIVGVPLSNQELLNATFTGPWLEDAKKHFSGTKPPAYEMAKDYMNGKAIRQEILETALKWISDRDDTTIEGYMAKHQQDKNANELWLYFMAVINWAKALFPNLRSELKTVPWGILYNEYHDNDYDKDELEETVAKLMQDKEVKNKTGIYSYVFTGEEKDLNLRTFDKHDKTTMYERQKGICPVCKKHFELNEMHADHIVPWSKGGKTDLDNGQMLCAACNLEKSNK